MAWLQLRWMIWDLRKLRIRLAIWIMLEEVQMELTGGTDDTSSGTTEGGSDE